MDRVFLHCPGANNTFQADDIPYTRLAPARLLHFGYPPLMRRMFADDGGELERVLAQVKAQGLTTSLDMAKPDPESEAGRAAWHRILKRVLPHADLFLPSLDEILYMLDRPRWAVWEAASRKVLANAPADGSWLTDLSDRLLDMGVAVVALKLGHQGLYLRTSNDRARWATVGPSAPSSIDAWLKRELLAPCFQVDVVGTTGSGDCTIAGFLTGWLKGLPPEEVMTGAVAVGACNVEKADAVSGVPAWAQVQERIRSNWPRRGVQLKLPGWRWDADRSIWIGPADAVF
jgi:sugar/nucleoside kinase (ribokinase family)